VSLATVSRANVNSSPACGINGCVVLALKLPPVMFHALRHSHASALIAAGVEVLTISRRLGHGTPAFTLTVYGHLFSDTDAAAARAIDAVMEAP
jgi:integrase